MRAAGLTALLSHWRRHPVQLSMLLMGLALATALWSGVQAINAEARASYDRAAALLGQDRLERIVAADGGTLSQTVFVDLRRAGWLVSPVVEGRIEVQGRAVGAGAAHLDVGREPLAVGTHRQVFDQSLDSDKSFGLGNRALDGR